MASPAPARYALLGAGISALALALLQTLLAQRLERAQIAQMGPEVAFNLRLAELALDRLPPQALARLSGLPLLIGERPPVSSDGRLRRQADQLRGDLCQRLDPGDGTDIGGDILTVADFRQLLLFLFQGIFSARDDVHLRPKIDKALRDHRPDPNRTPRHQCDFAFQRK